MNIHREIPVIALPLTATFAVTSTRATEPSLNELMQGLRRDTMTIVDGLITGNMVNIPSAAERIADHDPIPASQLKIIKTELGSELKSFAQFDKQVHSLSLAIKEAAAQNQPDRVFQKTQEMLGACMMCHTTYKDRVSKALKTEQ